MGCTKKNTCGDLTACVAEEGVESDGISGVAATPRYPPYRPRIKLSAEFMAFKHPESPGKRVGYPYPDHANVDYEAFLYCSGFVLFYRNIFVLYAMQKINARRLGLAIYPYIGRMFPAIAVSN